MLVVIAVTWGLVHGAHFACLWGLRRSRDGRPARLLGALILVPIGYTWAAEAFGWPTPWSLAVSSGLMPEVVDRVLFAGATIGAALLAQVVLMRAGVTDRLERWSAAPG